GRRARAGDRAAHRLRDARDGARPRAARWNADRTRPCAGDALRPEGCGPRRAEEVRPDGRAPRRPNRRRPAERRDRGTEDRPRRLVRRGESVFRVTPRKGWGLTPAVNRAYNSARGNDRW